MNFSEKLGHLIAEFLEYEEPELIISDLELHLMALKEEYTECEEDNQ